MALVGNVLYVANSDALVRFPYTEGQTEITANATKVADFPPGPLNHHWTKSLIASPDGLKLYVGVGSNSNVAEHGMDEEEGRAAIWEIDRRTGQHRVFASGLRNPVGLAWEPDDGHLWVAVNERDDRVKPARPDLVARAIVPDYALGPHTASLGLAWSPATAARLPERFRHGMFVGQHGSWNREPRSGYRVIFVPFVEGSPAGDPID